MPVLLYWTFGSLALAMLVTHFWSYEHSLGALVFYAIVAAGVAGGFIHRNAQRTRTRRGGGNRGV